MALWDQGAMGPWTFSAWGVYHFFYWLEFGLHISYNSDEHTTVGSGGMRPLDLRFAHQDQAEGPLHGGAMGPWAYGPVVHEGVYLFLYLLNGYFTLCSTRRNLVFARIRGHGAHKPAVILLLSNRRTRGTTGPGAPGPMDRRYW